jgi:hypothetical protein
LIIFRVLLHFTKRLPATWTTSYITTTTTATHVLANSSAAQI